MKNKLFSNINSPEDLKKLAVNELIPLSDEIRNTLIETISQTGGHLGSNLGVVELTIALHYVFNSPTDSLVWDVSHQSYIHKMLTGRKDKMLSIRQKNGISGFISRAESVHDCFGAGHSSTSISASVGIALANKLNNIQAKTIAIIGDGSLSGGLAFEGLNNANLCDSNLIVIVNDNNMSIDRPTGALSAYLSNILTKKPFDQARHMITNHMEKLPTSLQEISKKVKSITKEVITGDKYFEHMGFDYYGILDGHDIPQLVSTLSNLKNLQKNKPILLHVKTNKGNGYHHAENAIDKLHGVTKFNVDTGKNEQKNSENENKTTLTQIFSESLLEIAKNDEKIIAITSAMLGNTGLQPFKDYAPHRVFDVGIAEMHSLVFASGLAIKGFKPFVAVYSTFLQRAYDGVIHDVSLQNLPVKLVLDRAGYVGADGKTHAGMFDLNMLVNIPHMVVLAPSSPTELVSMLYTMSVYKDSPIAIRFPKGVCDKINVKDNLKLMEIGKSNLIQKGSNIAILSLGGRLDNVKKASDILKNEHNIHITIIDSRFAKPLDVHMLKELAQSHKAIITIEEGITGGYGSSVAKYLTDAHLLGGQNDLIFKEMSMPDEYIEHATIEEQYTQAKLDTSAIVLAVKNLTDSQ